MGLDLGDIDAYHDPNAYFTLHGKRYTIPPVSGEVGLWVRAIVARRAELADDATDEEVAAARDRVYAEHPSPIPDGMSLEEAMLGRVLVAELVSDGVSYVTIEHLAEIARARLLGGDALALTTARGEDDPNSSGPANRQERRAAKKTAGSGSRGTSTAGAATTRTAASGNGTSTRPRSLRPAKTAPSRGAES